MPDESKSAVGVTRISDIAIKLLTKTKAKSKKKYQDMNEPTAMELNNNKPAVITSNESSTDHANPNDEDDMVLYYVRKKKSEYSSAFTIHGLMRVYHGDKYERTFWALILVLGISLTVYFLYEQVETYQRHETVTNIRRESSNINAYPSLVMWNVYDYNNVFKSYCGEAMWTNKIQSKTKYCQSPYDIEEYPPHNKTLNLNKLRKWYIDWCGTSAAVNCKQNHIFTTVYKGKALIWNYQGVYNDSGGFAGMRIKRRKNSVKRNINVLFINPKTKQKSGNVQVMLKPDKYYKLYIKSTKYIRLPHPFQSNCVHSNPYNYFPGVYTRESCVLSFQNINVLKICGDVLDYFRPYVPKHLLDKYQRNVSFYDFRKCYKRARKINGSQIISQCPLPCEEIRYQITKTEWDNINLSPNQLRYRIEIYLRDMSSLEIIEERPFYTWDQVLGIMGGFVGLLVGASVISLVEMCVFGYYHLYERYLLMSAKNN